MKNLFGLAMSVMLLTHFSEYTFADDASTSTEMSGYFKELKLPIVKITEPSNPGVWSACAERAHITTRSGIDKLARLDPKPGNKVLLTNFRINSGRCYFDELEVLSRESAKKPERTKMNLKPHIAEGYLYGFNPSDKGYISLSPRTSFAADETGTPLKCSFFSQRMGTIKAHDYQEVMTRIAENYANWYDYGRQRQLVRLTEVQKGRTNDCTFEQIVPVDKKGNVIASPFNYRFEYTPGQAGFQNHQHCLLNAVSMNVFPISKTSKVTLLDYCRCVGVRADKSNASQAYKTCSNPKLYEG